MLEWLHIKGFQRHKNRRIDFDPHCTTIVGVNDAGKTATLRALRWLAFNEPQGNEFFTWGFDTCTVSAGVDGHKIVRKKSKKVNFYKLNGKRFKIPRTSVPEEIAKLLNVGELNFQGQDDPTFLLASSPGQISRELNSVIDLEEIDNLMANAATSLRKLKEAETLTSERLQEAREKKKELSWVVEVDKDLQEIEELQQQYKKEVDKQRELVVSLASHHSHVKAVDHAAAFVVDAARVLAGLVDCQKKQAEVKSLNLLINEYSENSEVLSREIPDISELSSLYKKRDRISNEETSLGTLVLDYITNYDRMCDLTKEIKRLERQIKGKRCPTCGQKIRSSPS